jgi:citrate lyase subunit beta/citryl-CoA lyase
MPMKNHAITGNHGENVRSDCRVSLVLKTSGGIRIDLRSKVAGIYGNQIRKQISELLPELGIPHAEVGMEDSGALPFVISARLEAAASKLTGNHLKAIPGILPQNRYDTERERIRFSRLYLPGNNPGLMLNAGIHGPDGIILDLEDSVAPDRKEEARILVRNALCQVDFYGAERMVRINQLPAGLDDLDEVVPFHVNMILIPKCESARQVREVDERISQVLKKTGRKRTIYLMPIIETCLGVENAFEIAGAGRNVAAMAIGLEDYTADLGVQRTEEGQESLYARMRLVNACKAAGIQPIDSVFSDVSDMDGLRRTAHGSRALGFEGMGCIHPRQVAVIREAFCPSEEEILRAEAIVSAFKEAMEKGLGVVSLGSKMIDAPVVKRAQRTMELAFLFGLRKKDKST